MIVIERSTRAPRVLVVMLLVAIVLRLVFQPVAAFGGLGSSERQAGTAGGEASKATSQSITANVQLIGSLEAFKAAVLAKIDSDVETTARAFWDAYDIQRSRRVADFVLAPLTVIEQAIGVMAFGKSAPDILAGMERAENLIQVVSLLMGLSQLRQMGERLQTALDGPTYSSLVKETLKEAGASSQPGEYATTLKLYLYGIGGRRSPIGVSLQIGSADGASREVVWGAEAVKRRVSDRIKTLIRELAESPVATEVQADTMRMHVATLTEALKRSRADNVTVAPALVSTTTGAPPDLVLGSIGALEQVRREVLAQYDNDLRMEQISVLTSALKAGTQVISLRVGYKTPGGQLLKEVQRDVITPGAVLVNTLTKTYATGSRYQVASLPHEMVLSLPGELATSWKLVDEVVAAIRSLTSARVVTAGSNVQEASPMSQPVYAQSTPPDFVTKTTVDPETQVRFSLKRKYIEKMGKKWFTFETVEVDPCRWHPGGSVFQPYYVFGEVPATVNLADDATARLLLERGKAYAAEQCGKGKKDDVEVVVRLYQSAFDEKNWESEWAVFGRHYYDFISRKEELRYENKPLQQAERRRQEEEKRQRAEEEQRRRQAEAAAKQARLQEMEALRRSGPKALLALTQALGDKDAEVRGKAAGALWEIARAGFSELGPEAKDAIPALTEASKKGNLAARYALRRIKFPSSPPDPCRDELSERLDGLLASERARPCPVEGDEEKKAAADKLNVAFTRRYGVQSVACEALSRNPFAYEGKVVALNVTFEQMIARDRGLFGVGDVFGGCGVTVSGIPQGVFSTRRVNVVLAGRVLGNTEVKIGPATLQVPHLQYVGVHICNEGDCADFFGPASMRK